ncbi:putative DNA-binding transcriptional regulator YafY [Sporomusaceae bacterium BoRhaA]|uniref:helix-turn-helix transcriptional regulator n=1 Tax=Pelorhabdus rhamnosifermentans TaxID=2772457 RepID=UPI001C05FA08|nr:YafY family protein [Pelorhabdus rhamnosifermentans]MBU2699962.1 putative DNA-binding transcriptional regulator YafY [Pelorhabdus rhamnosifermentans]
MKISRLFEITIILLNKGTVTARELAERFGVSTRTIYRDIDVLSTAGVPVYMNKGNGGGISLLENYAISRTIISDQESESLLLAVKTLQATQYPELDKVLQKMGSIFKNASHNDWVEIDFSHWGSMPNERNKFNDIKRAMLQRKVIRFDYVDADGCRSNRLAEPEKLLYKGSSWYLIAYCRQRQDHRMFRISRLKNVDITAGKFVPKRFPVPEKGEMKSSSKPLVQLNLRFQAKVLNRLYDEFDDALITKNDDGSFDVKVVFPEDEWVYGYIMSFGNFVEVLEPEHIRKIIADRMEQALKIYEQ